MGSADGQIKTIHHNKEHIIFFCFSFIIVKREVTWNVWNIVKNIVYQQYFPQTSKHEDYFALTEPYIKMNSSEFKK